jgi:hypothetical protein
MTTTTRRQSSRDSGFSLFRMSMIAAVIGGLFLVGAFVLTQVDTANQRQPLNVEPPAGAELRLEEDMGGAARNLYYFVPNMSAEEVASYYDQRLRDFYGGDITPSDICQRSPSQGNFDGYTEGSGMIPYQFKCLFGSSSGNPLSPSDRTTEILVQPGVRNDATGMDNTGGVVVEYYQRWQP